jgi:hypothetical protein
MKNIYDNGYGYRVMIKRASLKFDALFKFGSDKPAALARAIAERDAFFAACGETSHSGQKVRSNTGIAGISEVTKWFHNRPLDCFQVTIGRPQTTGVKRFTYHGVAGRERALRAAIAHRTRATGEDPAQLLNQAREAMCL